MDAEDYTVSAVAGLTGVSVRTLHHYDETGLLQPSGRNAAGYRLYSPQDLQRLQRVLFYRELGFGLDTIAVIVDDPGSTDGDHLRRQRQLLAARDRALPGDGGGYRQGAVRAQARHLPYHSRAAGGFR